MNPQRLFHTVITLYEKHRAAAICEQLGISPFAVRVLDVVTCLPGIRIEDVESLLTTTRAKVVSAVFELSGRDLLTHIDPSIGHEDIRLHARSEMLSARVAEQSDAAPADLTPALKAYQQKLLDQIAQWTAGSAERTPKALLRASANAEFGEGPSG
ncbi:hypothetical protein [Paraburkholderia dipogonis]|uniref:hypothetical protein n=1 Tax=Paraburkholderia dipogonis TaxID=1211383 RepID=UPI0038B7F21A